MFLQQNGRIVFSDTLRIMLDLLTFILFSISFLDSPQTSPSTVTTHTYANQTGAHAHTESCWGTASPLAQRMPNYDKLETTNTPADQPLEATPLPTPSKHTHRAVCNPLKKETVLLNNCCRARETFSDLFEVLFESAD